VEDRRVDEQPDKWIAAVGAPKARKAGQILQVRCMLTSRDHAKLVDVSPSRDEELQEEVIPISAIETQELARMLQAEDLARVSPCEPCEMGFGGKRPGGPLTFAEAVLTA
jgi:hypothetical protein